MTLADIALATCGSKTTSQRPGDAVQTALVIPDTHVPLDDQRAVDVVLQAIQVVRPNTIVHLGDLGEWGSVSAWQWKRRKRPPLEYQLPAIKADFEAVNAWLDRLDAACTLAGVREKVWCEGNHDAWVARYLEEHPYLSDTLSLEDGLRLASRGWTLIPEGDFHRLGDLRLTHGSVGPGGVSHARTRCLRWGASVLYGHTHDRQSYTLGHIDGPVSATSLGCLKRLDREANPWMRGSPSPWSHAFGLVHILGGKAHLTVIPIYDGRAVVHGRLIAGRE